MSKFIITGPARLTGEISVNGAKNAALKIIPAALLSREKITIKNLPRLEDISRSLELAADLGAGVERKNNACAIEAAEIGKTVLEPEFANAFRSSIMFAGPLLARVGEVSFPHPGGCVIGAGGRPIDLFLDGFRALGAEADEKNGYYRLRAKKLKGGKYFFTTMSVTATEALMMTAVLAEGKTELKNCALEPEITALADYLNAQGARINGAGTPTITVNGVKSIKAGEFEVMPDRIEAGSFALLAAAARAEITVGNCAPEHLSALLAIFKKIGVPCETGADWLKISPPGKIKPLGVKTHEYPGFPTDLQAPYTVLMTQAAGASLIHETIYDRRLLYTDMLLQMGANITMCDPHRVVVEGPTALTARRLTSPDLRAGIALVIAALIAQGRTEIDNIYQIDRGYEDVDGRLRALGADIKRVNSLKL